MRLTHVLSNQVKNGTKLGFESAYNFVYECSPPLYKGIIPEIENFVALDFAAYNVCWIKMNKRLKIESWNNINIKDFHGKSDVYDNIIKMKKVTSSIPEANVYISEDRPLRPTAKNASTLINMNSNIHLIFNNLYYRKKSLIIEALNENADISNIYTIKGNYITKFFKLLVTGERISSRNVASQLLFKTDNYLDTSPEFTHFYSSKFGISPDNSATISSIEKNQDSYHNNEFIKNSMSFPTLNDIQFNSSSNNQNYEHEQYSKVFLLAHLFATSILNTKSL